MSINFESHKLDRRSFLKGAGMVGAAGLLAACGGKSDNGSTGGSTSGAAAPNTTGATPLKEFISFESGNRELESWNMLYTQRAEDANVITNLWDGLLSFDCYGKVVPAIASSWEHNDDSTVWTFHLRDDVDWVDANGEVKDHLTSKDFLVGFEWVMNAYKNEANNTSMPNDTVVGAADYYEQTKAAGDAAADMTYEDMLAAGVGIEAPDDYTLVFTCKDPCPYFDTVAAYNSFYPVAPALLDELGIEGFRGCDNTTMWYNGPYVVEEYIQGNTKSYIPNPSYYDAANVSRFERLTITMISDGSISLQLYENRELDEVDLGESSIATIQADPSNVFNQQLCEKRPKKFSYCFIFNYDKRKADGTADENWNKAIANKAFRQCFSKGLELSKFYARYNPINPLKCENDFFTMSGLCYTTDGTDYTSLVAKELGLVSSTADDASFVRGNAVEIFWNAMRVKIKNSNETLSERLIAQNVFTQEQFDTASDYAVNGKPADSKTDDKAGDKKDDKTDDKSDDKKDDGKPDSGEKKPEDYTWEEYLAMTGEERQKHFEMFESLEAYLKWMEAAKAAYEKEHPSIDVGGDGSIDIGDIIGKN